MPPLPSAAERAAAAVLAAELAATALAASLAAILACLAAAAAGLAAAAAGLAAAAAALPGVEGATQRLSMHGPRIGSGARTQRSPPCPPVRRARTTPQDAPGRPLAPPAAAATGPRLQRLTSVRRPRGKVGHVLCVSPCCVGADIQTFASELALKCQNM